MTTAAVQRVYGGQLRKTGDRLEFTPTRRWSATASLFVRWFGMSAWTSAVVMLMPGELGRLILLCPVVVITLATWVTFAGSLRTALEWSRMAPPRRGLVIERAEAIDFRRASEFVVTLDGLVLPPTSRRALFEIRDIVDAYVLVVGDRAVTMASFVDRYSASERDRRFERAATRAILAGDAGDASPDPASSRSSSVLPLIRGLIAALALDRDRFGVEAGGANDGKRVGLGATGDRSRRRRLWGWLIGMVLSFSWQFWMVLRVSSLSLSSQVHPVAVAVTDAFLLTMGPAGLFLGLVKWGLVPELDAKAANLIAMAR
jgi:hypothetical protein